MSAVKNSSSSPVITPRSSIQHPEDPTASKYKAVLLRQVDCLDADALCVSYACNACLLAVGYSNHCIRLFCLDTSKTGQKEYMVELAQSPLISHTYAVHSVHFTPQAALLASCSQDGRAILWQVSTGHILCEFSHESRMSLRVCAFSPSASLFATGGDDETVALWDITQRCFVRSLSEHESTVPALAWTPDGAFVCTGSCNGELRIWDIRFGDNKSSPVAIQYVAHDLGCTVVAFSPTIGADNDSRGKPGQTNGQMYLLASGGNDDAVRLWRLIQNMDKVTIQTHNTFNTHEQSIMCLRFSHDGRWLATGAGDKKVIVWDVMIGQSVAEVTHQSYVTAVCFGSDQQLITASNDKTLNRWQLAKSTHRGSLEAGPSGTGSDDNVPRATSHTDVLVNVVPDPWPTDTPLRKSRANSDDPNCPDEYLCPITRERMLLPVIAADGYTYEQAAITSWFQSGKKASPMTNQALDNTTLTPNRMLKMLIDKYSNQ